MSRDSRLVRMRAMGRSRGSATLGLALVVASVAGGMALGTGVARHKVTSGYDPVWVPDSKRGQVVQVDPSANKANLRLQVSPAGDPLSIQQGGGHLVISDQRTGRTTSIDLSTLLVGGVRRDPAGSGVKVLLDGSRMYVANLATGVVQAVDPASQKSIGKPWSAGGSLVDVVVDGNHTMWALDSSNHLVSLTWNSSSDSLAQQASKRVTGSGAGSVVVGHDKGVTVVGTGGVITRVGTGSDGSVTTTRPAGPLAAAQSSPGDLVPVSDPGNSSVMIVDRGTPTVDDVSALGCRHPGDPVAFNGSIYVPCLGADRVLVLDRDGNQSGAALRTPPGGDPQLVLGQDKLLITVPGAAYTTVVDRSGSASQIQVVDPTIGVQKPTDPPPTPPAPPTRQSTPPRSGGNHPQGGNGDGNGNGDGHGGYGGSGGGDHGGGRGGLPGGTHSSPAPTHPSGDTPSAGSPSSGAPSTNPPSGSPASGTATAAAQSDGTVVVSWAPSSGTDPRTTYAIDVVGGSKVADAPAGATSATVTVLSPGTTAAFEVQALAPGATTPTWSADTAPVTTYSAPGAVTGVSVTPTQNGANAVLAVQWTAAAANGRPVTYSVSTAGVAAVATTGTAASLTVPCSPNCSGTVTVTPSSDVGAGTAGSAAFNSAEPPPPPADPAPGETVVTVAGQTDGYDNGDGTSSPAEVTLDITAPSDWANSVGTTCTLYAEGVSKGTVPCNASHVSNTIEWTAYGSHTYTYYVTATWSGGSAQSASVTSTTTVPRPVRGCTQSAGVRALTPSGPQARVAPDMAQCQPCSTPPCPLPNSAAVRTLPDDTAITTAAPARSGVPALPWFRKPQ